LTGLGIGGVSNAESRVLVEEISVSDVIGGSIAGAGSEASVGCGVGCVVVVSWISSVLGLRSMLVCVESIILVEMLLFGESRRETDCSGVLFILLLGKCSSVGVVVVSSGFIIVTAIAVAGGGEVAVSEDGFPEVRGKEAGSTMVGLTKVVCLTPVGVSGGSDFEVTVFRSSATFFGD
jgi:hypothetical protein